MKPNAIYSKSGKGVQEASGKTSLLKRADRSVLSAIDGRATLAEVAQKVGKSFDGEFEKLIAMLDKDGFVREVSTAGSSTVSQSRPALSGAKPVVKAPAKAAASPSGGADDLDFTSIVPTLPRQAAPAAAAPRPVQPTQPPRADPASQQRAKEQEAALYRARQEAEARAQAERDRVRLEAEAKARAEAEAKIRAETEKKLREEAELKQKAAAAAAAKAKAEAEAQAKLEAERRVREAEELRQRLEAEERRRKEEEERRRREEEERRAHEEAVLKARAEAEKAQREAEELRRRLEEERKAREAEEKKRRELEEARLAAEAEQARMRQARELEEARERARSRELEQSRQTAVPALPTLTPGEQAPNFDPNRPAAATSQFGAGSLDALMADLDSFSQREETERQARDAADRKEREEKKRKVQEDAERRARDQAAERERQRAAEEARRREEEERRAQEEAERRVREAEEQRRLEAEERRRRAQEVPVRKPPAQPQDSDLEVSDADLGMDDVKKDEAAVAREARKAQRERERETRRRQQEARERAQSAAREEPVKYPKARRPRKWGRPVAIGVAVMLVAALGAVHVMPLPAADYEAAASEALGRPVRIGSARLSLFTGVRLNLSDVRVGDGVRIASVQAYPRIGSLFDQKKAFSRIELYGASIPQQGIGGAVSARLRGSNFEVERIYAHDLKLDGPVPLPKFQAEAQFNADGAMRAITLRGPESLDAKLTPTGAGELEFDVTAANLNVPFVPELSLATFAMKGSANGNGMKIVSWGGSLLDGVMNGSANVRWSSAWQVDGTLSVRGINAAWFAPALLSEGKAEGTARFSMSGADPAKLHNGARLEGSFSVGKGALGTFDLSRLLQTSGRQHGGRTPFTEMTGQAVYDRGAVALRNVNISAGALTAGASADISSNGALAGKIVADVRTTLQPLRGMLVIGGTVKEPQVRN